MNAYNHLQPLAAVKLSGTKALFVCADVELVTRFPAGCQTDNRRRLTQKALSLSN
jgi:hypothetical protein